MQLKYVPVKTVRTPLGRKYGQGIIEKSFSWRMSKKTCSEISVGTFISIVMDDVTLKNVSIECVPEICFFFFLC